MSAIEQEQITETSETSEKIHEKIAEALNLKQFYEFNFKDNEEVLEMMENCKTREQNSVLKDFEKIYHHFVEQYISVKAFFNLKKELKEKEKEINELNKKIDKLTSKKEKKLKSSDEEAEKKPSAVTKPIECYDFVSKYMSCDKFKESNPEIFISSDKYSRNDIHTGIREFITIERENNPDKINVTVEGEEKQNNKMFNVYG